MGNQIMKSCPGCGAQTPEGDTAFCPYCGRELIDLSREKTDKKIADVKRRQSEMTAVPRRMGAVVTAVLLVLFLVFSLVVFWDVPGKVKEAGLRRETERLSGDMQSAYEKEDWELLKRYLIDECEEYLDSPAYFQYRTAWFLHTYPPLFDEAYKAHDAEQMLSIYEIMAEDYNMRADDIFFSIYETDEEIEAALAEEVERETEIMAEEGLEDEMYKLRR